MDGDHATQPAWVRLEEQIAWYDRKASNARRSFQYLKVLQIVTAAIVPVVAAVHAPVWVVGGLGSLIVILEGLQQVFQFQENWINYRSTCESLRRERAFFLARAGPYAGAARPLVLLVERTEGYASREHEKWVAAQEEAMEEDGAEAD
jgi:Protein of unknown function (DUF4231)